MFILPLLLFQGYKSNSSDDDDGLPNDYDLTDSFIDASTHNSESEDGFDSNEDITEVLNEGNRFLKVCCCISSHSYLLLVTLSE